MLFNGSKKTILSSGIKYVHAQSNSSKNKKAKINMPYERNDLEARFDDFVEETNQKIKELESVIRILQNELSLTQKETTKINITNQDIRSSLGATIKTVGDIVRKNGYRK